MKNRWLVGVTIALMLVPLSGCLFFGHKKNVAVAPTTETEPDKILFERGVAEIEKGHYDVGRLTLQTLINTYPDSEYLAKAKLQIADSFYKQGGTAGLVQAKAEYKDFITFFPNDPDAAEAQMKAAMTHYKRMEKPDRDRTQARDAEEEFKIMLASYPKSPYAPEAQQKLREVQEVLAEGNFEIGRQYFIRRSYVAAVSRLQETLEKYPDYSGQDRALYLLGQSYERSNNDRAAGTDYAKIVQYFPTSEYFDKSKERLSDLNLPIPATDSKALAIAQQEDANRVHKGMMGRMWGMFKKSPDVTMARTTPSPMPPAKPQTTTTASRQTPSEGGGGPAVSADITVGTVHTSGSGSGGNTPVPSTTVTNPPPSNDSSSNPPAAAAPSSSEQSTVSSDTTTQDSSTSSKKSKQSTSKKKKGLLRKVIPF
ncbi:MAG: outer membrane protein assembly factor BamD [Acidobacteriia bacterium]|nr:outer membrane protein assembly factor BamD [Terriglobia bacterium]